MMGSLSGEWRQFKERYLWWFLLSIIIFFLAALVFYFYCMAHEDYTKKLVKSLMESFKNKGLLTPGQSTFSIMWKILSNNIVASLMMVITGLIPIIIIPLIYIAVNGGMISVVLSVQHMAGVGILPLIFAGLVPHGIFEMSAIFLAAALGQYHGYFVLKNLFKRTLTGKLYWQETRRVLLTYIKICVPLLIIAAFVEAFITGWLLQLAV